MDFITPVVKFIWPILKKYWPFFVIVLLFAALAVLWWMFKSEREAHDRTESDRQRWIGNASDLYREASANAQTVEILRSETARIPGLEKKLDSTARSLDIRTRDIRRLHTLVSASSHRDTVVLTRDSLVTVQGVKEFMETIPISMGCFTGSAVRMVGNDTAYVEGTVRTDLSIVEHVEKTKGHVGRDIGRFFTFRWKRIGSDKWRVRVDVSNNCDPSQKWEKNIIFDVKPKRP